MPQQLEQNSLKMVIVEWKFQQLELCNNWLTLKVYQCILQILIHGRWMPLVAINALMKLPFDSGICTCLAGKLVNW